MKTTAVCPSCRKVGWYADPLQDGFVLPVSEPCDCPVAPVVVRGHRSADDVLGPKPGAVIVDRIVVSGLGTIGIDLD